MLSFPPEYQEFLLSVSPAGTTAALKTDRQILVTGTIRVGSRPGILEFEPVHRWNKETPIETATVLSVVGGMQSLDRVLARPAVWNSELKCWDLQIVAIVT